jgi:hypothetical protein
MPLIVTDLGNLPAPFCGFEDVQMTLDVLLAQKEYQTAVVDENGIMMAVHLWKEKT